VPCWTSFEQTALLDVLAEHASGGLQVPRHGATGEAELAGDHAEVPRGGASAASAWRMASAWSGSSPVSTSSSAGVMIAPMQSSSKSRLQRGKKWSFSTSGWSVSTNGKCCLHDVAMRLRVFPEVGRR
jgi:hypothetical protein